MKKGLGVSWFPWAGWEGSGKPKTKHEKGVACFMVPERGAGRTWEGEK